jgi:uncharacterized membrane protein YhaH (DUF805 family)
MAMREDLDVLFGLEGRIDRSTWWGVRIIGFMVLMAVSFPLAAIYRFGPPLELPAIAKTPIEFICTAIGALAWWINFATTVKRWHDRDHSGWMSLIQVIPFIGPIWTLVECGFLPSTPGRNRYGPSPADSPSVDAIPVAG